jgi:V8-like Glu-specific endopeptidase
LFRLWPEVSKFGPRLRKHPNRRGVLIVEGSPRLKAIDPPGIKAEAISGPKLKKLEVRHELDGYYAEHLPLVFRPRLIEKARRRVIRRGNDIPNSVFAPDTRYIFRDTSFPWCVAGKVETELGGCTGTMIGRRLMLTGSHCIKWTADGAGWIKFTPSYYNGDAPFGVAWGARVIYWQRADGSDGLSDQETAFDYVVVVLDGYMGDLTGYAGYRAYSSSWNDGQYWQQIGYPGDLSSGERPAFFSPGAITSAQSKSTSGQTGYVMGHFMDTAPGHSGGPYWGWWDDEPWPRVVGTDSTSPSTPGNDTSGDNEAGGGPALSSLISYARTNYS